MDGVELVDAGPFVVRTRRIIKVVEESRRAGDPPTLVAPSERVREALGRTPRKPEIETMIADAWAWHRANPEGYLGPGQSGVERR